MPRSSSVPPPDGPADTGVEPVRKATGGWWRAALASAAVVALISAAFAGSLWAYEKAGPLRQAKAVVIPEGSTALVARRLALAGVIDQPHLFTLAALATSPAGPLHAAELLFPAHASFAEVLRVLRTAPPVEHELVIPEGLTAKQITAILQNAPLLVGPADLTAEGYILPATYDYVYGTRRSAIIARAHAALERVLVKLWVKRAPDLPFADPAQALILASIVERETAVPAERPRIAAVFINRLRLGMKLQADPTVIYAASDGEGSLARPLSVQDLAIKSPYNTYLVSGLPPGPIDAPGVASIEAVLHPAASPDLYFVNDGRGGHAFARTLEGQDRNIRLWEQRLRETQAAP